MQVYNHPISNWRSQAACKGVDPEVFFPDESKETKLQEAAYAYCRSCPVTRECFISALKEESLRRGLPGLGGDITGIRGGKSAKTRWLVHQGKLSIEQALDSPVSVYNVGVKAK